MTSPFIVLSFVTMVSVPHGGGTSIPTVESQINVPSMEICDAMAKHMMSEKWKAHISYNDRDYGYFEVKQKDDRYRIVQYVTASSLFSTNLTIVENDKEGKPAYRGNFWATCKSY